MCLLKLFLILFVYFKKISGDGCEEANTFNFTDVYTCISKKQCTQHSIESGCLENMEIVHIKINSRVRILDRETFKNLLKLRSIDMRNVGLQKLIPKIFVNIPKPDWISLRNNEIEDIETGVFTNTIFTLVDLKANKIKSIGYYAFASMPDLWMLSLSDNHLSELSSTWFHNSPEIEYLYFSNNKFEVIDTDMFTQMKKLNYIDLSFNRIHTITSFLNTNHQYDILNLARNQLRDINFLNNTKIKKLYISLNRINKIDEEVFASTNITHMFIHPNPWQCTCLNNFEKLAKERGTKVEMPHSDLNIEWKDEYPICLIQNQKQSTCSGTETAEFKNLEKDYFNESNYKGTRVYKPFDWIDGPLAFISDFDNLIG